MSAELGLLTKREIEAGDLWFGAKGLEVDRTAKREVVKEEDEDCKMVETAICVLVKGGFFFGSFGSSSLLQVVI